MIGTFEACLLLYCLLCNICVPCAQSMTYLKGTVGFRACLARKLHGFAVNGGVGFGRRQHSDF